MSDASFVLELFSEEIPARLQMDAEKQLGDILTTEFTASGLIPTNDLQVYAGSRRLLALCTLPVLQPNRTLSKRGPRVGAPEAALSGFLSANGVTPHDLTQEETEKGTFYILEQTIAGQPTAAVLPELVARVLLAFRWPVSMRWGSHTFRWVRPLRRIGAVFAGEPLVGGFFLGSGEKPAGYAANGESGFLPYTDYTTGHRLHHPSKVDLDLEALEQAFVIPARAARARKIQTEGDALAAAKGLSVEYQTTLLAEVVGLTEWPVPILGEIPAQFMTLPPEVLMTSMRVHQKYFSCFEAASGQLAPYFLAVSNQETPDEGASIKAGNEKVLSARLYDAAFFWQQDTAMPLEHYLSKLETVIYHARGGSMGDRVRRIVTLAQNLAPQIAGTSAKLVTKAATLCKADLATGMVGEFPELQGIMGGYYAAHGGAASEVCHAITQHYRPQGAGQPVPTEPTAITIALAEKLDALETLFAAGEAPSGSKDPFALRRAALGVVRIVTENTLDLDMFAFLTHEGARAFLRERAMGQFQGSGLKLEAIQAVFAAQKGGNFNRLFAAARVFSTFLESSNAEVLLASYARATNIVRTEERKEGRLYNEAVKEDLLQEPAEKKLFEAVQTFVKTVTTAIDNANYQAVIDALAALGAPLAAFFENIMVNTDNAALRHNRLCLLAAIPREMEGFVVV